MSFVSILFKFYIVVLIFRWILTQQELNFNQLGRIVAKLTDPIFKLGNRPKSETDKFIPLVIFGVILLYSVITFALIRNIPFLYAFNSAFVELFTFIIMLSVISLLIGLLAGPSAGVLPLYFYRIGLFWVKAVRKVVPVKSNIIVLYAIILISIFYILSVSLVSIGFNFMGGNFTPYVKVALIATEGLLLSYISILYYLMIAIVIRALMSWVSPDPRNLFVQFIIVVTEPVIMPLRRIIPPIGMIDLSAMVAIFVLYMSQNLLTRFVMTLFSSLN